MPNDYRSCCEDSRSLRLNLVNELVDGGAIESNDWINVFSSVPRHVFVPRIFTAKGGTTYEPLDGTDPTHRDEWLRHVYSDDICITQIDGNDEAWNLAVANGSVRADRITCTSSQPSLMAAMLEELNVRDDDRILEIGTGTGYNAALLCERLGSDRVVSVDIDPLLVQRAKDALTSLGYYPDLVSEDGGQGAQSSEKHSKIIATASFSEIPPLWLNQATDGGLILANIFRPLGGGILAALTMTDGEAAGHFSSRTAAYMPTRALDVAAPFALLQQVTDEEEEAAELMGTEIDAASILKDTEARFFLALMSDFDEIRVQYENNPEEQWILTADGSWAFTYAYKGGFHVKQGGKRRIWDEFESIYTRWIQLGQPRRNRFGLTATTTQKRIWLDNPDQVITVPGLRSGD